MNPETALQQRILAEVGASETHRLWRNATGLYHAGRVVTWGPGTVRLLKGDAVIRGAQPVHAGLCDGSADLVGIVSVPVRLLDPDSVAGLFTGIELKAEHGGAKPHQRAWLKVIRSLGGIGKVARSVEDVRALLKGDARD